MAVFRIEKTRDYTVMSNHHLRNTELSLKAKGLLSLMLSLPDGWDYTTKGLARICKDGVDSICAGVQEPEKHGYVIRECVRLPNGQLGAIEYTILEQPRPPEPKPEKPERENPVQAKPVLGKPEQDNPDQLNYRYGKGKIIKSMPDGGSVAGWIFEVYRFSDNSLVGTYTMGADGTITTDYLLPGEYVVKEIIDDDSLYWCEGENPQTVTIAAGQTAEVHFTNHLKPGEISILKVNQKGEPLAGAEFLLEWSADGVAWKPVPYTDSPYVTEGTCTSVGLSNGRLTSAENAERHRRLLRQG